MQYLGDRAKYWETSVAFPPTGSSVELFIDGSKEDTFSEQREFYRDLMDAWPQVLITAKRAIESCARDYPSIEPELLAESVSLSSVSVPKGKLREADWGISFQSSLDPGVLWTVNMNGLAVSRVDRDS
jgi:hypothetical protein